MLRCCYIIFDKLDHLPKFDIDIFSQQVDVHQLEKQASTGASPPKKWFMQFIHVYADFKQKEMIPGMIGIQCSNVDCKGCNLFMCFFTHSTDDVMVGISSTPLEQSHDTTKLNQYSHPTWLTKNKQAHHVKV